MPSPASLEERALTAVREAPPQVAEILVEMLEASQGQPRVEVVALIRAMRALATLLKTLHLHEAAAQASDFQVLISILQEPEVQVVLSEVDPLAGAKIRGLKVRADLLAAEGGCAYSNEFADAIGVSPQAIDKARKAGSLIAFPRGQAKFGFPRWQIHNGAVLRGLKEALQALGNASEWTKANFFLTGNSRLHGQRPLDLLRDGQAGEVVAAAVAFGEQGAA